MRTRSRMRFLGALPLLVFLTAVGCGVGPTAGDGPVSSEVVLDLSAILGDPADQRQSTLRSVIARVALDIDGNREIQDITGDETQVTFPVSIAPGTHDFTAQVLSNTDVVLAEGSARGVSVTAEGFEVPLELSAVSGVLFVRPGEVAVGGSVVRALLLENRGSQDLSVIVGPFSPPDDTCFSEIPCLSVFGFDGTVSLAPGGSRELSLHAGSAGPAEFSLRLTADDVGFVDLPVTVTAPGTGRLEVRLTRGPEPVSKAAVTLQVPDPVTVFTDDNGEAVFTDVPLGSWTVFVPDFDIERTATLFYGGDVAVVLIAIG